LAIVMFLTPVAQLLLVEAGRARQRRRLARARGSSVVDVIHRLETVAIFGLPLVHWVGVPLTRETLRDVAAAPAGRPLDLVVHLPTGIALGAEATARVLLRHRGKVTLIVPHYAFSGALLLAMAADEVMMDEEAAVGALDLRSEGRAAAAILVDRLKEPRAPLELKPFPSDWRRDEPLNAADLRQLGFNVTTELPPEVHAYLSRYRQPPLRRPWPFFIDLPDSARRP
jgi:hypothetical protein